MQSLEGQDFVPSLLAATLLCYTTLDLVQALSRAGWLVVCGVGVHLCGPWVLAPNGCCWSMALTGGAERGKETSQFCQSASLATPQAMTVGPCSQFLFHVSDSPVVMACFKIALCLRL